MATLSDNFQFDTGQITSFVPIVTSGGITWSAGGTVVITGGQLVLTAPPASSSIKGNTAGENTWTIAAPSLFVSVNMGLPTWQRPFPSGTAHFGCGIVKDASNCLMFELGPDGSLTTLTVFVYGIIAGVSFSVSGAINNTNLPDAIGFGLVNNIVTAYVSFGGIWQTVPTIGSGGNVDVSGHYDFTAGGALTGWTPGVIWGQFPSPNTTSIAASQILYTAPFASPITGVMVPDVTGDTQSAATTALAAVTLTVGTVTTQISAATAGTVINQNPVGGANANIGSSVDLVLAIPGIPTTVPNLVNQSLSASVPPLLAAAGLILGAVTYGPSVLIIAGNVISQSPAAGTSTIRGASVSVLVSTGRGPIAVPDLIGLTQADAVAALVNVGLAPGAIGVAASTTVPAGVVISQNIGPGIPYPIFLAYGSLVGFVVSSGPPPTDTLFNYEPTVISQYANSPTLLQWLSNMNQYMDQSSNFANFLSYVWNVDSAVGFGLDIWGRIVNVARLLQIPNTTPYVGFDIAGESQPAQDWTPAGSSQPPFNNPPVGGAMYTGHNATEAYLLDDNSYRQLILAKAFANICSTTAPAINQILQNLYGVGQAYVLHSGVMAITYNFNFKPTPIQLAILEQSGVIPTPPGVAFSIVTP